MTGSEQSTRFWSALHVTASVLPAAFLIAFAALVLHARMRSGAWPTWSIETYDPFAHRPSPREGLDGHIGLVWTLLVPALLVSVVYIPLSMLTLARILWFERDWKPAAWWTSLGTLSIAGLWLVLAMDPGGFFRAMLG